jgi:hypothetical protein
MANSERMGDGVEGGWMDDASDRNDDVEHPQSRTAVHPTGTVTAIKVSGAFQIADVVVIRNS